MYTAYPIANEATGREISFDSTLERDPTGEIPVLKKIIPINVSASSELWVNDTVEVFRACPLNGTKNGTDEVTLIGRNFYETPLMMCSFTTKGPTYSEHGGAFVVTTPATYESRTRVRCKTPPYRFPTNCTGNFDDEGRSMCDFGKVEIRVSNNGATYSTTSAAFDYLSDKVLMEVEPNAEERGKILNQEKGACMGVRFNYSKVEQRNDELRTIPVSVEEGERPEEDGWFMARGMSLMKASFDLRHIPAEMVYNEHYRIAVYVHNSSCVEYLCDPNRQRYTGGVMSFPCKQPIQLSKWFESAEVPKNNIVNMSFFALEDTLVRLEVQLLHGLYLPFEEYFKGTTTVQIVMPSRANITDGHMPDTRPLSRIASFEERLVPKEYLFTALYEKGNFEEISAPLNLPPHYRELERGRVLVMYNSTDENVPWERDELLGEDGIKKGPEWWTSPHSEAALAKEMQELYRETGHEFYEEEKPGESDEAAEWKFQFNQVVLPYMPFVSNCRGYDSYMPFYDMLEDPQQCTLPDVVNINDPDTGGKYDKHWWRRKYPQFPHQDDIKVVGPTDVFETPISDWCERSVQCKFEEKLTEVDVTDRWFEAGSGVELFVMYRHATSLGEYLEGGNDMQNKMDIESRDVFVPMTVDRDSADDYEGGCTKLCFPREVSLELAYYQFNSNYKRLINADLVYDSFDKDETNAEYTFSVKFFPLNYLELIVFFAFDRSVFITLFAVIGMITVVVAMLFWLVNRLTTSLKQPPRFRFFSFLALIAPPPIAGVCIGLLPICTVIGGIYIMLKGDEFNINTTYEFFMTDQYTPHWMENKLDPETVGRNRNGRVGLCFFVLAAYLIFLGSKIFLPTRISKREQEIEKKRDAAASKESVWCPTLWKRANMVFTSYVMAVFLVVIVEFSFWEDFGDNIWQIIILLKVVGVYVGMIVDRQVKEHLLTCPLMASFDLVAGIVTFGADDFKDFLLSYFVEFGMMMVERVYFDPGTKAMTEGLKKMMAYFLRYVRRRLKLKTPTALEIEVFVLDEGGAEQRKKREVEQIGESSETVEPILDAFSVYACATLALFYQPFIIAIFIYFREEVGLPDLYGIKRQHMEFYMWFALVIMVFQLAADIFIHNVQELFHGWKVYDYLVYTRYRFLQRETRWKGLEDSLDECIEEGMRTIDQMCFSSQFYFMNTLMVSGIILLVMAIEIMLRADYNMFGDVACLPLALYTITLCYMVQRTALYCAWRFKFWKIKHENTAWHSTPEDEDDGVPRWDELEKIKGASHEAYLMNQRITSETFRYKFLNYNRAWLVAQLPSILTPRTLRRSRPYLITQFTKILGSVNPDISSDSQSDEDPDKPKFGPVALSAPSRNMIRMWLAQARRRRRLREVVQPIINQARKAQCEQCLSQRQLQVELVVPLEVLGDKFERESMSEEFDQVAWKEFFRKHAKFRTLCLECMLKRKEDERNAVAGMQGVDISDSDEEDIGAAAQRFGPVFLSAASRAIMIMWYRKAQDRIFGRGGRARPIIPVSSDDDDERMADWAHQPLHLSAASKALALKWLFLARTKITMRGGPRQEQRRDPYKVGRKKPGKKVVSGKKSAARRK